MRYLIILFFLFPLKSFSQVYQSMPQYGYGPVKRMDFDSSLTIPTTCGVPTLRTYITKKAAIAYDSCNKRFYYYDPKLLAWDTIKSGSGGGGTSTDTTSLSNRINLKLNITDTNVFVRKSDTTLFGKNFANSDLFATGDRYHYFGGYDLRIDSTRRFKILGADYDRGFSSQIGNYDGSNELIIKAEKIDNPAFYGQLMFEGYDTWYLNSNSESNGNSQIKAYGKDIQLGTDSLGAINFKYGVTNSYQFPKTSPSSGNVIGYVAPNTLGWVNQPTQNGRFGNDTATIVMAKVHNDAGSTLTNGEVVYLATSGTNANEPSVKRAINKADSTSANTFGFVYGTIAANDTGWIVLSGKIEKLNTSAFANGDIIYLDSIAGKWTKTKPQAPYHLVYLGVVIKSNAGNGSIFVKPQNGYEIEELHDVQINNRINNQIIVYSDTQKVWKNRNVFSVIDSVNTIQTKFRSDTSINNVYSAIANKLNISDTSVFLRDSDSALYQTKFRSDTMRTNVYNQLALELNVSDSNTIYQTKFRSDTSRANTYTALTTKQDKSISAYSMLVNNTNASANMTTTNFQTASGTYTNTITFTGTQPTGTTDHTFRWQRIGNIVTLSVHLFYQNAGSSITQVVFDLPTGAPTPLEPSSFDVASGFLYGGVGQMSTTNALTTLIARCGIRSNASNNGYELFIVPSSGAAFKTATITITYFAQ